MSNEIKVLEVLPGNRAIVSTEGLVRLAINGEVYDELIDRETAEYTVNYFADTPSIGVGIVEYQPQGGQQ